VRRPRRAGSLAPSIVEIRAQLKKFVATAMMFQRITGRDAINKP